MTSRICSACIPMGYSRQYRRRHTPYLCILRNHCLQYHLRLPLYSVYPDRQKRASRKKVKLTFYWLMTLEGFHILWRYFAWASHRCICLCDHQHLSVCKERCTEICISTLFAPRHLLSVHYFRFPAELEDRLRSATACTLYHRRCIYPALFLRCD